MILEEKNKQSENISPLVLIGLPRSGSTLLTRILNESPDLFMVNDLYYLQEADAIGAFQDNDAAKARHLIDFLLAKIRRRSSHGESRKLVQSLLLNESQLGQIEEYADQIYQSGLLTWHEILKQILSFAAQLEGKQVWGWNTPQDYLHLARIREIFPASRFLFLLRNPYHTLRSAKNVDDDGNDPRRYHPLLHSTAWRLCAQTYLDEVSVGSTDILLIRYEDVVHSTEKTLTLMSNFLETTFPAIDLTSFGTNSSYRKGNNLALTETEHWLCDLVTGSVKIRLGYKRDRHRPKVADAVELVRITKNGMIFYGPRLLFSSDVRSRVKHLIRKAATMIGR